MFVFAQKKWSQQQFWYYSFVLFLNRTCSFLTLLVLLNYVQI